MAPRKDAKAPIENAPSEMEIEEEQSQLKAKRTLCYFAFDTLMHYFGQMEQRPELDFPDAICAFCIQWKAKSGTRGNKIQLEPVSLKNSFAEKIIALLKGEKKPITLEEVPRLECHISLIEPSSIMSVEQLQKSGQKWTPGVHGVQVQFKDATGKTQRAVFLPDTIKYKQWSLEESIEQCIRLKHKEGPLTPEIKDSLIVKTFTISKTRASYDDYRAYKLKAAQKDPVAQAALPKPLKEEFELVIKRKSSQTGLFTKKGALGLVGIGLFLLFVLYMRIGMLTYNVEYEDFLDNYRILGVSPDTPLSEINKLFRRMSVELHPDKNKGCTECAEKYMKLVAAHQQINDYEKGTLKLTRRQDPRTRT